MSKLTSDYCFKSETSAPTEIISRAWMQDSVSQPPQCHSEQRWLNTKFSSYQLPKLKVALPYSVFVSLFCVWKSPSPNLFPCSGISRKDLKRFIKHKVYLRKIWVFFRGHRLCYCPGFTILCFRELAGISAFIPLTHQTAISEVTRKKKSVSPEAPFVGSQQVFKHPAQTADLALGYTNKNASALENLSRFVP